MAYKMTVYSQETRNDGTRISYEFGKFKTIKEARDKKNQFIKSGCLHVRKTESGFEEYNFIPAAMIIRIKIYSTKNESIK